MNSNPANQNVLPFPWFPKTNPPLTGGAQSGQWMQRPQGKLKELADSLVYEGNNARINALPSPWSRALQLEQAILNPNYPTRAALLNELLGCLACIGLWKTYGLRLQAKSVNLASLAVGDPGIATDLSKTLFAIRPSDKNSLYKLTDNSNPWDKVYVLELDGINIGFTSPTTLVCPTAHLRSAIAGMEEWTGQGSFRSPAQYLGDAQKQLLADWLSHVGKEIAGDSRHLKNAQMAGMIGTILSDFASQLTNNRSGSVVLDSTAANGFPLMGPKALTALAKPIGGIDHTSDGTIASQATILLGDRLAKPFPRTPKKPLVLVDPEMEAKLGIPAKNLVLFGNATAQSVGFDKTRLVNQYGNAIEVIGLDDLFLPDLYLLSGESAFVESTSWLSSCLQGVPSINGQKLTPLLPFQERVRDLFSSKELSTRCTLRVMDGATGPALEVTLAVDIQGLAVPYPITRKFDIKESNVIDDPKPVVAIWPNVPEDIWKTYYIFSQASSTKLTVDGFIDYLEPEFSESGERAQYFKTDRFPDLIKLSEKNAPRGIIPVIAPTKISNATNKWRIGFDFGTSFTNFVIDDGSKRPKRIPLQTMLMLLTKAEKDYQDDLLYRFFMPDVLFPKNSNPPTATALNTVETSSIPSLFHEARVQWPSPESKAFRERGIRTGFKWEDQEYQYPFLLQLTMMISANALADHANTIEWHLSYPSALSSSKTNDYRQLWEQICDELELLTGLTHRLALGSDSHGLQTEAVAFAKYFGNYLENVNLVHTACMDVGGGTTDISIWQDNECLHQVSVKFAGRDICTDILRFKPSVIRLLFGPEVTAQGDDGDGALRKNPNFNSWLDNIFRNSKEKEFYKNLRVGRKKGGLDGQSLAKLASLMAVGFGGLYYYIGIVLRSLSQDGKLISQATMPVLIGGNGARFLNWIDSGGNFNRYSESNTLFERLQLIGSGFADLNRGSALTTVSENFKEETALGLISEGRTITHEPNIEDGFISGETIIIGDQLFKPLDRISLGDLKRNVGKDYQIGAGLEQLRAFVSSYDAALVNMESLLPIKELEPNDTLLWNNIERIIRDECAERAKVSDPKNIEPEPPFITCLKALIKALTQSFL